MSSRLTTDILFPNKVWRKEIDYDIQSLMLYIQKLTSNFNSVLNSNYGGWQSPNIDLTESPNSLIELKQSIDEAVGEVCKDTSLPTLCLDNLWFNVNPPGTYNIIHTHPRSLISGVFYIDVPADNMGNIRFYRDDAAEYYITDDIRTENSFTSLAVEYAPKNGVLLLFPSWLKHSVQGNMSTENRVSMSFNYGVMK